MVLFLRLASLCRPFSSSYVLLLTRIRQCGLSFKSCKMASMTVQVLPVPGGPKITYGTCAHRDEANQDTS